MSKVSPSSDNPRPSVQISRGRVIVFPKTKHRQFPQYQVLLHVFSGTSYINRAMEPLLEGERLRELQPGQLVAACLIHQEELHSFHLPVFGLVDMDVVEQFTTTRAYLLRRIRALDLANQDWELGSVQVGEAEEVTATSDTIEDLVEFTSEVAKLGDYVLGESMKRSAYQRINELRGIASIPTTISPALRPSYTSIVGTSSTDSSWLRATHDSALVPCLSFEWSTEKDTEGFIYHCLGYGIRVTNKGVALIINRYYPTRRSDGIRAMQLVSHGSTQTAMQCGFMSNYQGVRRFISIPRLDTNALNVTRSREKAPLEASLAVMRASRNEGSADLVQAMEGYLARLGPNLRQPLDKATWIASLLQPLEELLDQQEGSSSEAIAIRNAMSAVSKWATTTQAESGTGLDPSDPDLKAAFDLLRQLGHTSSLYLCGRPKDELPLSSVRLLPILERRPEAIPVIELDSSPPATPLQEVPVNTLEQREEPSQSQRDTAKRTHTTVNRFDGCAVGSNSAWIETVSGKRQRLSEANTTPAQRQRPRQSGSRSLPVQRHRHSEGSTGSLPVMRPPETSSSVAAESHFVPATFYRQIQGIIDGATDYDYAPFIRLWSQRLKKQATIELALADNISPTIMSEEESQASSSTSASQTAAERARRQVTELQRSFLAADLNRKEPHLSRWLKIKSVYESWDLLDILCNEIEQVYQGIPVTSSTGRREETELRKAFARPELEYGKPLIDMLIYLFQFIIDKRREKYPKTKTATYAVPGTLVERMSHYLLHGISASEASEVEIEDDCTVNDTSSLSSAPPEPDSEDEDNRSAPLPITAKAPSSGVYIEWKSADRTEDELYVYARLVFETLLQMYCPQVVTCLSSTVMDGEEPKEKSPSWINKRRWVFFRLYLIQRLIHVPMLGGNGGFLGKDVFSLSIISRMIFAPSRFFPYPSRQEDTFWPSFYRYDGPYVEPCMYGKRPPFKNGVKDQDTLDKWTLQTQKVLAATEQIISNASQEIAALADKIRSVAPVQ